MADSELLQELNLTVKLPRRALHQRYIDNCEWRTCPNSLCGG